jgi:hydrogenase maturation protease
MSFLEKRARILVLGLGNPLLRDDSIGLRVAAELKPLLAKRPGVDVEEEYRGGLRLMERMAGYDGALVIDSIQTGAPPGKIHRLTLHSIPTQRSASAHDVNLPTALALGRIAGVSLPPDERVFLVGIEAEDILTLDEECTPAVRAAIPEAVRCVLELLDHLP